MPLQHQFTYKNVTISGLPGSGSTTLLNMLREKLKFDGWKGFSGGEFMRSYAAEKGLLQNPDNKLHHDATVYAEEFDRQVDMGIREKLETEQGWIIESWLSGFFAQDVPNVLKILVYCSDDAVRIDRIVNRDLVNVTEAKKHIHERKQKNVDRWIRMYGDKWQEWVVQRGVVSASDPIDFWLPELYDITIDTYSTNQAKTLQIVLDAIQKK